MQFLKTLFWVLIASSSPCSRPQLDAGHAQPVGRHPGRHQVPLLLLIAFLIGWLPTWLLMRARIWRIERRIDARRNRVKVAAPPATLARRGAGRHEPDLRRHRHARPHRAVAIARAIRGLAGGVKLGLEFFAANGRKACSTSPRLGLPVFLDLKFHDIPNTVAKAVEALAPLGARDPDCSRRRRARDAGGRQGRGAGRHKVVAVTVLTSLDRPTCGDRRRRLPGRPGRAPGRACRGRRGRRHRLFRRGSRGGARGLAGRLFRGSRRPSRRGDAPTRSAWSRRARRWTTALDPGHRPADHRGRRSRGRRSPDIAQRLSNEVFK